MEKRVKKIRRAQLAPATLITMVLVILGFIILLYVLISTSAGEDGEYNACKLSVLTKASTPDIVQERVPLNCRTNKVCLGYDGKDCDNSFAGEKIEKVEIKECSGDTCISDSARKFEEIAAKQMYRCWDMMGEGKLKMYNDADIKLGLQSADNFCMICTRIAVDAEGKEKELLDKVDLPGYLKGNKPEGESETYLQKFTDKSINAYARVDEASFKGSNIYANKDNIDYIENKGAEFAVIYTQINPQSYQQVLDNLFKAGATMAGGGFVLSAFAPSSVQGVVGGAASRVLLSPAGLYVAGAAAIGAVVEGVYIASNIYESKTAAAGYCGEFTNSQGESQDAKKGGVNTAQGCSMVQVVPYDSKEIIKYCKKPANKP